MIAYIASAYQIWLPQTFYTIQEAHTKQKNGTETWTDTGVDICDKLMEINEHNPFQQGVT